MCTIIALALQKGGVGKTTTTAALAFELVHMDCRVLCVDFDPQSNLTQALGVELLDTDPTIYEVLMQPELAATAIRAADCGVDLIPASLDLAGAEQTLANRYGRELLLRTALTPLRDRYDYILIDSPPSLGFFTANVLTVADTVLVPLQAHPFALKAMGQLDTTVQLVRQLNPALEIGGILLTMTDRRTSLSSAIEAAARAAYGDLVFQATIPLSVKLAEAPTAGQPISVYAAHTAGANAYRALAAEVRQRWPVEVRYAEV